MPKEHFSVSRISPLLALKKGASIHIVGVAGVAMAQLALLLERKGFKVSGTDKEFYEPTGSLLKASTIKLYSGYKAENIPSNVDLVVIGNAITYSNPEVDVVEKRNLPYTCFPAALYESIIQGKHSIVVSGTHGKSTTTALIASALVNLKEDPSYFIGGVVQSLPSSLNNGGGKFSVVEGDEYDSAFFAKVPKFAFYKPDTLIVNAIEFDHADIYSSIDAIKAEFDKLVLDLKESSLVIACVDFPEVKKLVEKWRAQSKAIILTFGMDSDAEVVISERKQEGKFQTFTVLKDKAAIAKLKIPLIGAYNARNATAVFLALTNQGLPADSITSALSSIASVKRRQEIIFSNDQFTVIEDFAHHPTSVRETLSAVREAYSGHRIWAVFEPRSNTSRRKIFENDYIDALQGADVVIISEVPDRGEVDAGQQLMDVAHICQELIAKGVNARQFASVAEIHKTILSEITKGDVITIMSNGAFGGLQKMVVDSLIKK